jgi:predicted RNA-binding protein with PIN domain
MNEDIIIDGYNLIRQSETLMQSENFDLEAGREHLLKLLSNYKKIKRRKIAVIFDGGKSGNLSQHSHMERGIRVVFSKDGQEADDVIKNIARDSTKELIIVSSDNDIQRFSEKNGCVVMSSKEFLDKIEMAQYLSIKGMDSEDDEIDHDSKITTRKKGNPKKLSKNVRKRKHRLKKL